MHFLQSSLWRHITITVYQKPTRCFVRKDIEYQVIAKQKRFFGITWTRYQLLGSDMTLSDLVALVPLLRTTFCAWTDLYIQIGSTYIIDTTPTSQTKSDSHISQLQTTRQIIYHTLISWGFAPSIVENMPPATVMIDLSIPVEQLQSECSSSTVTHIRKASRQSPDYIIGDVSDWDSFYTIRSQTGQTKGFATQQRAAYDALCEYLTATQSGHLYLAKVDGVIACGAIVVYHEDTAIYLYGATDRAFRNAWLNQGLHRYIIGHMQQSDYRRYDFLGCSSTGDSHHHLASVSQFKQWFGGTKIEYVGSRDVPLHRVGYRLYLWWKQLRSQLSHFSSYLRSHKNK